MSNYCTKLDVEAMYGQINIRLWSDVDNLKNQTSIDNRIDWACEYATEIMNSHFVSGKYAAPFASPPKFVKFLTAMQAGILLYDGRQVVNSMPPRDQMTRQRRDLAMYIMKIKAGQMRLLDALSAEQMPIQTNYPTVVNNPADVESGANSESCCCTRCYHDPCCCATRYHGYEILWE